MKPLIYSAILSLFFLSSCSKKSSGHRQVETVMHHEQKINEFLNSWHQAASDADFDGYFSKIAQNGIFVGTDEEEVWSKQEFEEFSKPFFDKKRAWDFKTISRNIYYIEGTNVVAFDETLDTWMGICRGSGIVTQNAENQEYEIRHYVLSLTIPNESINKVMEAVKETEE